MEYLSIPVVYRATTILALAGMTVFRLRNLTPLGDWRALMAVGSAFLCVALIADLWAGVTHTQLWDLLIFKAPACYLGRQSLLLAYICLGGGAIELIRQMTVPRAREDE